MKLTFFLLLVLSVCLFVSGYDYDDFDDDDDMEDFLDRRRHIFQPSVLPGVWMPVSIPNSVIPDPLLPSKVGQPQERPSMIQRFWNGTWATVNLTQPIPVPKPVYGASGVWNGYKIGYGHGTPGSVTTPGYVPPHPGSSNVTPQPETGTSSPPVVTPKPWFVALGNAIRNQVNVTPGPVSNTPGYVPVTPGPENGTSVSFRSVPNLEFITPLSVSNTPEHVVSQSVNETPEPGPAAQESIATVITETANSTQELEILAPERSLNIVPGFGNKTPVISNITGETQNLTEIENLSPTSNSPTHQTHLSQDFEALLNSSQHSDVTLLMRDQNQTQFHFRAHRAILAARSSAFARIFKKKSNSRILLSESQDIEVWKSMFQYIYSGKMPSAETLDHFASQILEIANKYELPQLKSISEQHLLTQIATPNVVDMLVLADNAQATELRSKCIRYITEHVSEVMISESWAKNMKNTNVNQKLMVELFETLAGKDRDQN